MEKVRLSVDELQVQSFATTGANALPRGTVRGHDAPSDQFACPTADVNWDTCWDTCACHSEGNTGDCTVICESDACSAQDCTFTCDWDWSWVVSRC
jgi:hypothetical protein